MVEIEISDNGKGIENIELARRPLYTTNKFRKVWHGFYNYGKLYG